MSLEDYLILGLKLGHISTGFCVMHDGPPLSKIETQAREDGTLDDFCISCVRVYLSRDEQRAVEEE